MASAQHPRSEHLTVEQAFRLLDSIQPHSFFLHRLRDRKKAAKFPEDDPIRSAAEEVCASMGKLTDAVLSSAMRGKSASRRN